MLGGGRVATWLLVCACCWLRGGGGAFGYMTMTAGVLVAGWEGGGGVWLHGCWCVLVAGWEGGGGGLHDSSTPRVPRRRGVGLACYNPAHHMYSVSVTWPCMYSVSVTWPCMYSVSVTWPCMYSVSVTCALHVFSVSDMALHVFSDMCTARSPYTGSDYLHPMPYVHALTPVHYNHHLIGYYCIPSPCYRTPYQKTLWYTTVSLDRSLHR